VTNPTCPYCNQASILVDSAEVYHGRSYGPIYLCRPCKAYVGVHKATNEPLGRLANADLRRLKMRAHEAFDPIWKSGRMKRKEAYSWLSSALCIDVNDCHIGMFNEEACEQVVRVCERFVKSD